MKKLVLAIAAAGLLGAASFAQACSLSAWNGGTSGAVADGGPGEPNNIPRLSGLCAMSATGAGYVQDNSPADEPQIIVSFYYLATGTGNATLLTAYQDEAGAVPIFTVSTDGSTVTVTPDDTAGAPDTATAPAGTGWVFVMVDWTQGGTINLYVNSDPTAVPPDPPSADTGTSGNATSTISSTRLGAEGGLSKAITSVLFDQYESRRTQLISPVLDGDANGDGTVGLADAILMLRELFFQEYNSGQPDTNRDGAVGLADAILALRILFNLPI